MYWYIFRFWGLGLLFTLFFFFFSNSQAGWGEFWLCFHPRHNLLPELLHMFFSKIFFRLSLICSFLSATDRDKVSASLSVCDKRHTPPVCVLCHLCNIILLDLQFVLYCSDSVNVLVKLTIYILYIFIYKIHLWPYATMKNTSHNASFLDVKSQRKFITRIHTFYFSRFSFNLKHQRCKSEQGLIANVT